MADWVGTAPRTLVDALAARAKSGRGAPAPLAGGLRELGALDRAIYQAISTTPTGYLDGAFRRLSMAADHSRLWVGIAATVAVFGGSAGRRAARDGLLAIGTTSLTVNLGVKPLARRRRPRRAEPVRFAARYVPMPRSTSFPSGHAASAFAFAAAVSHDLPRPAVPIGLLAAAVAYSRIHTGVHYPSDVVIGSLLGVGVATGVTSATTRHDSAAAARRLGQR